MLSRPLTGDQLKGWVAGCEVDPSTLEVVEPIYTAPPVFEGMSDPVPRGERGHADCRALAEQVEVPEELPDFRPDILRSADRGELAEGIGFAGFLALMGDDPGRLIGFHSPIKRAVASYAASKGAAGLASAREAVKDSIRAAIATAPARPGRKGDLARYSSDPFLDELIASYVRLQAPEDERRAQRAAETHAIVAHFVARDLARRAAKAAAAAVPETAPEPRPRARTGPSRLRDETLPWPCRCRYCRRSRRRCRWNRPGPSYWRPSATTWPWWPLTRSGGYLASHPFHASPC